MHLAVVDVAVLAVDADPFDAWCPGEDTGEVAAG